MENFGVSKQNYEKFPGVNKQYSETELNIGKM